jgi:hypothetical protein
MRSPRLSGLGLSCATIVLAAGSPARAETTVTFTSKYEGTIKVCVYNASDAVTAIPLKSWEIDPNKSVHWKKPAKKFHVKVFKPQFIDKPLAALNPVAHNTSITLNKDHTIAVDKKASLVFHNDSGKDLKFCAYKATDKTMLVPLKTWTIKSGKRVTWIDAPATFNLKLFQPGLVDKVVATNKGVSDRKTVRVTRKSGSYRVAVN